MMFSHPAEQHDGIVIFGMTTDFFFDIH